MLFGSKWNDCGAVSKFVAMGMNGDYKDSEILVILIQPKRHFETMNTMATERMFWLYFYVPLALLGLASGFFVSRYVCRRNGKLGVGLALLAFPMLSFTFYFFVLLTSGWYGEAAKFILLYTMVLAPPFWLGGILALPFTKSAKKNP